MAVNQSELAPPGPSFYQRLIAAPSRVLMLDYDGTLAPFRVERNEAAPYAGVRERIVRLVASGRSRVAVVSGRGLDDLVALLAIDPLPELWASHGWEYRDRAGRSHRFPLPESACKGLSKARAYVAEQGLEAASELKPASVAIHWRGSPRDVAERRERAAMEALKPIADEHGLELHPFDGGLELRVPGRNKGTAVREILANAPADAVVAYLGDDLTDEDAFSALPDGALGLLVRTEWRPTAATAWVQPPDGLLDFIDRWLESERSGG